MSQLARGLRACGLIINARLGHVPGIPKDPCLMASASPDHLWSLVTHSSGSSWSDYLLKGRSGAQGSCIPSSVHFQLRRGKVVEGERSCLAVNTNRWPAAAPPDHPAEHLLCSPGCARPSTTTCTPCKGTAVCLFHRGGVRSRQVAVQRQVWVRAGENGRSCLCCWCPCFPRGIPAVQGVVRVKRSREGKILSTQ